MVVFSLCLTTRRITLKAVEELIVFLQWCDIYDYHQLIRFCWWSCDHDAGTEIYPIAW